MTHSPSHQGFALPTLMLMLALASTATLLAMRQLGVNEQLINAEADRLRTLQHAEAVLPIALVDIVGTATSEDETTRLRHTAGNEAQSHAFFPNTLREYALLRQRLSTATRACSAGICTPDTLNATTQASDWKTQTASAMPVSAADTPYSHNTAWYWVEVFVQHSTDTAPADTTAPFVYRITVMARGVMPSSTTVLQAIWTRHSATSPTGQWHSWHVLHD